MTQTFDVVVVGGGPAGATAAHDLATAGRSVALLDRAGRIKPCGGAIPPRLIADFSVPDSQITARIRSARVFAPSHKAVDMPIDGGFVGMVDRDVFDEWLRARAQRAGAERVTGTFQSISRDRDGISVVDYLPKAGGEREAARLRARLVIGADGANSAVARSTVPGARRTPFVFAYHEIISINSDAPSSYDATRCDIYYRGDLSPDFYGWIFPHGATASIGVGSANKGFGLRSATDKLRHFAGLAGAPTLRREGAPIPMQPLDRWDNGRDVVLAGDASGVVAPASGEGIYYAMLGGRLAADACRLVLEKGDARHLASARKRFMAAHGRTFWILGILQHFWYRNDKRRERFVTMCRDPDVQRLTWQAYMNKELVRTSPAAHARIFLKDVAHLLGVVAP